jgi:hypothetical protein
MPAKNLIAESAKQAESITQPKEPETVRGPFPVGNMGQVSITKSDNGTLYATFTNGRSRPKGIPLAAAAEAVAQAE